MPIKPLFPLRRRPAAVETATAATSPGLSDSNLTRAHCAWLDDRRVALWADATGLSREIGRQWRAIAAADRESAANDRDALIVCVRNVYGLCHAEAERRVESWEYRLIVRRGNNSRPTRYVAGPFDVAADFASLWTIPWAAFCAVLPTAIASPRNNNGEATPPMVRTLATQTAAKRAD